MHSYASAGTYLLLLPFIKIVSLGTTVQRLEFGLRTSYQFGRFALDLLLCYLYLLLVGIFILIHLMLLFVPHNVESKDQTINQHLTMVLFDAKSFVISVILSIVTYIIFGKQEIKWLNKNYYYYLNTEHKSE